ncbi:succinylarginine dihydrolase [Rhodothalassium salexigens DSM 2132]|uniref:N-succinylarginine dihydrolase n=1 Tax=Rhodothalassium salexigens DSM 2132 TaxID=1188247 RepID=A0A4R2PM48_RHOSA|nr:N-succinylarginine dihydrolase [Rhodothalassium salexigens]MBB4211350.1 succinylarginine dihydrolase [Rhodothalassium salexigens DSM 2132]MBK1637684.1 N-succinylarginine dihydrolase [Rhodothalassium salexigens DSM 2132]TCP35271.1 succinylarginine dihydrolase [Rhodothalassium salexigens DSM 2132]
MSAAEPVGAGAGAGAGPAAPGAAVEVNFDGLVGPTHNYAGLSFGNLAAESNAGAVSNPRDAALQGLAKMRRMRALGLVQGFLPPHDRPHLASLRALGYQGDDAAVLAAGWADEPALMRNLTSASAMWTANAATVSPKWDTADGRTHVTPANLAAMYHRSIEAETSHRVLRALFADPARFAVHPPVPGGVHRGDEGAANHNRLSRGHGEPGVELFVYGRRGFETGAGPTRFPARQVRSASAAVARAHRLAPQATLLWRQNPAAIDAGAFHNDVVAVANEDVLFHHEAAFCDTAALHDALARAAEPLGFRPRIVSVAEAEVPLADAIRSYLFNSQLLSVPGSRRMLLAVPGEVVETPSTRAYVERLVDTGGAIGAYEVQDVRQSMRNGGGPACLRLRVALDAGDIAALGARLVLDDALLDALEAWVRRHYRDRLAPDDLRDPALMRESFAALDELTALAGLGSVYDFQR